LRRQVADFRDRSSWPRRSESRVLIDGHGLRLKVTANPHTGELRKSWIVRVTVKGGSIR